MYIVKADYKQWISADLLNIIVAEDENTILADICKQSVDTIKTKAGVVYAVDAEFEKEGTARNGYILKMALIIAVYQLYMRSDNEDIPAKLIKAHDDLMDVLDQVAKGKDILNLPGKQAEDGEGNPGDPNTAQTSGKGLRRFVSIPKRTHSI
jgi:hypothetical protein